MWLQFTEVHGLILIHIKSKEEYVWFQFRMLQINALETLLGTLVCFLPQEGEMTHSGQGEWMHSIEQSVISF